MLCLTDEEIQRIEKAFDLKLYDWQKGMLQGKPYQYPFGRGNGKTFEYCIELALSDGEPIQIKDL